MNYESFCTTTGSAGCCVQCESGKYSDSIGDQDCLPHASCEAGQGIVGSRTDTSNGFCEDCTGAEGDGTYNNASGLDSGSCHGPTHEVYTTSATEVDCAAGFFGTPAYGSDGSYTTGTCTACGAGKYRNKHNTGTTDCFEVVTGTVVVSQGSGCTEVECDEGYEGTPVYDADGEYSGGCTACADGTYKPQPGAAECEDVPPGFQGVVRGSTSHAASGATQIMECPSGTYGGATGRGPCHTPSEVSITVTSSTSVSCAPGYFGTPQYDSSGDEAYSNGCTACEHGKYLNAVTTGSSDCFGTGASSSGEYVVASSASWLCSWVFWRSILRCCIGRVPRWVQWMQSWIVHKHVDGSRRKHVHRL